MGRCLEGHTGYHEYLHSIGIALPDEPGGVTMEGAVGDDEDHGEGAGSVGDSDVSEGAPLQQPSGSIPNHTQPHYPGVPQRTPPTPTHPTPANPSALEPAPEPETRTIKPAPAVNKPAPLVNSKEEIIPGPNINERVRSGEATLEEPTLAKAHQVIAERLGGSQAYDPNAIQLADGSWGTVVQRENGTNIFLPVKDKPGIQSDDDF